MPVDVKLPVTVVVAADSPELARELGEQRTQEIIERSMKPQTRKEAFVYVATGVKEAKPHAEADA